MSVSPSKTEFQAANYQVIAEFMEHHFRHFNARETLNAARGFREHLEGGGKMLLAMAGAMSTGEMGVILARMIREGKIHAVSCTAANLEEDVFNLVAHTEYKMLDDYRSLSVEDEVALRDEGFNRVTDTCIPETVVRHLEREFMDVCREMGEKGESAFPYEVHYRLFREKRLHPYFQTDPQDSWLMAAFEMGIPVYSPGFEDSTLGNIFCARVMEKKIASHNVIKSGTQQMESLVNWYLDNQKDHSIGFFQIGGGIAGDFAICAVPLIVQDLEKDVRYWEYFCQISDSTTSYGSYSGAVPNEKITWHKLEPSKPKFMINSDAAIVAPLIFSYVLAEKV